MRYACFFACLCGMQPRSMNVKDSIGVQTILCRAPTQLMPLSTVPLDCTVIELVKHVQILQILSIARCRTSFCRISLPLHCIGRFIWVSSVCCWFYMPLRISIQEVYYGRVISSSVLSSCCALFLCPMSHLVVSNLQLVKQTLWNLMSVISLLYGLL